MNQDEILTKYNNCMSEIENQFPMDIESLKQHHKSTLSKILPSELQTSLPTNLEKILNSNKMNTEEKERKNSDTNIIKQKLYFDNIGKIFNEFNLDQKTTCQKIFDDNKTQIKELIKSINNSLPEDFDIDSEFVIFFHVFILGFSWI